jgi:putative endonuclease
MYYVYILKSVTSGRLYIGQTNDPEKRLKDHNRGASPYTKNNGPWKRIYLIECQTKADALALEKKLKAWKNPLRILAWINNNDIGG